MNLNIALLAQKDGYDIAFVLLPLALLVVVLLLPLNLLLIALPILYASLYIISWADRKKLTKRILIAWLFIILGTTPLLFDSVTDVNDPVLFQLGSWIINSASVHYFLYIIIRCIDGLGAMFLLIAFFPIYLLCQKFRKWKVPVLLVDIIELTFRYIAIMQETAHNIAVAQLTRQGYNGWRNKMKHLALLLTRTLLISHFEADAVYNGSLTRMSDVDIDLSPEKETTEKGTIIATHNLKYSYDNEVFALKGIDIEIKKGEKIALLGANGAGKSTLFYILAGIEKPAQGYITFKGQTLTSNHSDLKLLRRHVSIVLQNSNHQLFTPSVEDEIAFGLRNIGLQGEELSNKVEQVINQFSLQTLRFQQPQNLSEGQKKWVALASILALDPDIIILDEPTASLDRPTSKKVINLLNNLHEQGKTIIVSTHDMDFAYDWSNRSIVIFDGQKQQDCPTKQLFKLAEPQLQEWGLDVPLGKLLEEKKSNTEAAIFKPEQNKSFRIPLMIDPSLYKILIIGGGKGAYRKVKTLMDGGGRISLLAPKIESELNSLIQEKKIHYLCHSYDDGVDLTPYHIIVAATDNERINTQICLKSIALGKLVSSIDKSKSGNFEFAASSTSQGITIAVHTLYTLPELSVDIRDRILSHLPEDLHKDLEKLGIIRRLIQNESDPQQKIDKQKEYNDLLLSIKRRISL